MKRLILILLVAFTTNVMAQQSSKISGYVVGASGDAQSGVLVTLEPTGNSQITNTLGFYEFENIATGSYTLKFGDDENEASTQTITVSTSGEQVSVPEFTLQTTIAGSDEGYITDLSLLEGNDDDEAVSSILTASRDAFLNKAGFQFGSDTYFRVRGYDSRYQSFMINGIRFENPETGWQPFNLVGGLNDVLRYRQVETIGNAAATNTFGEVGGSRDYDLRPSSYRKGGRITYSNLNRSYNNRVMATYASGDQNGISYVLSGSHRWAQEGYIDGTYYDAYGFHGAVEGKVSDNYSVQASFTTSPRRRGTQGIHTQEAYDLAGSNYYNADWGYQDGEIRTARLRKNHNPFFTVSNYINLTPNTELNISGAYTTGTNVFGRIERQNAGNPDPDYYQNLPSFGGNTDTNAPFLFQQQIDWVNFYRANLDDENDDPFVGVRSNFILEDNKRDDNEYQAIAHFNSKLSQRSTLDYGVNYRKYTGNFYSQVNDLLGGDYWLDVDSFDGDSPNNVNDPDPRVYKNGTFGHDYDLNKETADGYLQGRFALDRIDVNVSGNYGKTVYWREGNIQTSKDLNNSLGKSEKKEFDTYGGKLGMTYKLDGRNYFSLNGMYYTKAPYMQTVFVNQEIRNQFQDNLKEETIYSGEANFIHKSPNLKLRATGYYTQFQDQAENIFAFSEFADQNGGLTSDLGNFVVTDIDKRHFGGEMGFEYKLSPEFEASGAASVGQYIYTNRPTLSVYVEDESSAVLQETTYLKNFYEDNTPQTAYNLGLTWRAPFYMFANIDANYYDDTFAGASPLLRTISVAQRLAQIDGLSEEDSVAAWTKQERLSEAFRLNLSLYKSIRLNRKYTIGINLIANNLLDEDDYTNLAFEQLRLDSDNSGVNPDLFPTRYRYATGRTYFINTTLRFR